MSSNTPFQAVDSDVSPALLPLASQQAVSVTASAAALKDVQNGGTTVDTSTRSKLNFVGASSIADDPTNDRVTVTVGILAKGKKTSSASTTGTTFGTGVDLLASALSFTADGTSDYAVVVSADGVLNTGTPNSNQFNINLDGSDVGIIGVFKTAAVQQEIPVCLRGVILAPSAGSHTVNVRFFVSAGTGQVVGGAGGAATDQPILVTVERLV